MENQKKIPPAVHWKGKHKITLDLFHCVGQIKLFTFTTSHQLLLAHLRVARCCPQGNRVLPQPLTGDHGHSWILLLGLKCCVILCLCHRGVASQSITLLSQISKTSKPFTNRWQRMTPGAAVSALFSLINTRKRNFDTHLTNSSSPKCQSYQTNRNDDRKVNKVT